MAKYIHSRLSREVEALMVQLAARAHRTSEERPVEHPIYFEPATIFCLCVIIPSTLRATRALWPSRAGPSSSLRVQLKSDTLINLRIRKTHSMPKRKNFK